MDNVRVVLYDMPARIKAYTIKLEEYYTICINSNLSHTQNQTSYKHELEHIRNGDYDRKCSADMIEIVSHEL